MLSIKIDKFNYFEFSSSRMKGNCVTRLQAIVLTLITWVGVWAFWFYLTQGYHPTRPLALIVTTSLVVSYATAAYTNHMVLLPRFWQHRRWLYICWLAATMVILTATALAVIRVSYYKLLGPDPDPFGAYKHFAIDLCGMVVHCGVVALVVSVVKQFVISPSCSFADEEEGK